MLLQYHLCMKMALVKIVHPIESIYFSCNSVERSGRFSQKRGQVVFHPVLAFSFQNKFLLESPRGLNIWTPLLPVDGGTTYYYWRYSTRRVLYSYYSYLDIGTLTVSKKIRHRMSRTQKQERPNADIPVSNGAGDVQVLVLYPPSTSLTNVKCNYNRLENYQVHNNNNNDKN